MKILVISDTHGQHQHLDLTKYEADVLVHAGDWTRGHDIGLLETEQFMKWLSEQPFKHKICIAGNHETSVEDYNSDIPIPDNVIFLKDSEVIIDGIKFYGSPYSNEFCGWAFMEEEVGLSKIWAKIPEDTNVLITHGPAYGVLDLVKNSYGRDPHVGSKSLTYRKQTIQDALQLHICGHIHEAYGIVKGKAFTTVNAAVLNEHYQLVNKPQLIEI